MPNEVYKAQQEVEKKRNKKIQNELVGIIHCHSEYSHDSDGSKEKIIAAAKESGLDFVIMTEHSTPVNNGVLAQKEGLRGKVKDVLFINGLEISKSGGSILAINSNEYIDANNKTVEQIIEDIHGAKGMAFLGHIEEYGVISDKIDSLELYNPHAIFNDNQFGIFMKLLNSYLACSSNLKLHPLAYLMENNVKKLNALLAQGKKISIIAGNDVHTKSYYPWDYQDFFKFVRMHVFSDKLETESVLCSLKQGKSYISFDCFANGSGFEYFILNNSCIAHTGDEIKLKEKNTLYSILPAKAKIRLIRNGELESEFDGDRLVVDINKEGAYRIEAYLGNFPWIISNHIYVAK